MSYTIQFTAEDVAKTIVKLLSTGSRDTAAILHHELVGGLADFIDACDFSIEDSPGWSKKYGPPLSQEQTNFVKDARNQGISLLTPLERLVLGKSKNKEWKESVEQASKDFTGKLEDICGSLPLMEHIPDPGTIPALRTRYIRFADGYISSSFYAFNILFSPKYQKDGFNLKEDIRKYFVFRDSQGDSHPVYMNIPMVVGLKTSVDYLTKVVMPLVRNIDEHSFDPNNDINGRLSDPKLHRYCHISMQPPKDGMMSVTIEDNGFGIQPNIYDNLFQRGTTRKDNSNKDHGVGLWGVKQFVEENGGTISCYTELGEGTTFTFTIPVVRDGVIYKHVL